MTTKLFLFDIEGTTTDFNFVHKTLFPYSRERMKDFVNQNESKLKDQISEVQKTIDNEGLSSNVTDTLLSWIDQDRKHKALKEIQGLIWDEGYNSGAFKGHVYPDVRPFFEKIKSQEKLIGIYSSGSVHAQKMIMANSTDGDLSPFISYYFDTSVGHKREKSSYQNIAHETKLLPEEIHFFSDIPEELEAAKAAGLKITHVVREGTAHSEFVSVSDFKSLS